MKAAQRNTFALEDLGQRSTDDLLEHICQHINVITTLGEHSGPILTELQKEVRVALEEIQEELAQRTEERARQATDPSKVEGQIRRNMGTRTYRLSSSPTGDEARK